MALRRRSAAKQMCRDHGFEPVTHSLCDQRFTAGYDGGSPASPSRHLLLPDHVCGICLRVRGAHPHRRTLRHRAGRSRIRVVWLHGRRAAGQPWRECGVKSEPPQYLLRTQRSYITNDALQPLRLGCTLNTCTVTNTTHVNR
jgi:hypothetical protein